jgi:hypothetical protein
MKNVKQTLRVSAAVEVENSTPAARLERFSEMPHGVGPKPALELGFAMFNDKNCRISSVPPKSTRVHLHTALGKPPMARRGREDFSPNPNER